MNGQRMINIMVKTRTTLMHEIRCKCYEWNTGESTRGARKATSNHKGKAEERITNISTTLEMKRKEERNE